MSQAANSASRLCVSLARADLAALVEAAHRAAPLADLLELRLDALTGSAANLPESALKELVASLPRPLLFTNRPAWEGGQYQGPEEQRVAPLLAALAAGCAWVDIELRTEAALRNRVIAAALAPPRPGEKVPGRAIVSWHDFTGTPDATTLAGIVRRQQEAGAAVGKLVTMAHSFRDVLRVLALQELAADLNFPLIAFCMGDAGMISRLATCRLGGFMTYAAAEAGEATAPGQLPAAVLRQIESLIMARGE
ncbi:type I 3-dehydroquinate dehydratase [Desulfurivibrio sp. D14AmB]|uniref:type I 3-dehydroquinate dehydratase n=1 Tax=Desulfurivibrio sp. D14AmB TaxID=3374370 RepID=UPI00376F069F